ncbi:12005_t:CDS:1, partial [Diversispora eburnea]
TNQKQLVATPGSQWSNKELEYFKIECANVKDFKNFFQESPPKIESFFEKVKEALSIDISRQDAVEKTDWGSIKCKEIFKLAKSILAVTKVHPNVEGTVDNLARRILELFDYDEGDLYIQSRNEVKLEMCGSQTYAKPDLCVELYNLQIKLLIQEDKSYKASNQDTDAEFQVIAEAIVSFQENSKIKKFKPPLESQLIPCITLLGTYPTFYLFEVTRKLSECVKMGNRPEEKTIVKKYDFPVLPYLFKDVMLVQEHRKHIFQCYEAFKKFVVRNN